MTFDHLVVQQFPPALHIAGMQVVPIHPVPLALAAGGLTAGAENDLDVGEERLVDRLHDDRHVRRVPNLGAGRQ